MFKDSVATVGAMVLVTVLLALIPVLRCVLDG